MFEIICHVAFTDGAGGGTDWGGGSGADCGLRCVDLCALFGAPKACAAIGAPLIGAAFVNRVSFATSPYWGCNVKFPN